MGKSLTPPHVSDSLHSIASGLPERPALGGRPRLWRLYMGWHGLGGVPGEHMAGHLGNGPFEKWK